MTNLQIKLQHDIATTYQRDAAEFHANFRRLRDDGGFGADTLSYYQTQAEARYAVARIVMGNEPGYQS
jgi:hypothetical protein